LHFRNFSLTITKPLLQNFWSEELIAHNLSLTLKAKPETQNLNPLSNFFCFILTLYNSEVRIFYFQKLFLKMAKAFFNDFWTRNPKSEPLVRFARFLHIWNSQTKLRSFCFLSFGLRSFKMFVSFLIIIL
jgi:hypothetical protein